MAKLTLLPISTFSNGSAVQATNENNDRIEAALENTLSRNGLSPNQMQSDFDVNGNDVMNVKTLTAQGIVLNGVGLAPSTTYIQDADHGDIIVSGGGVNWTIDPTVLSAYGRTLINDTTSAAARTTLELGTAATSSTLDFATAAQGLLADTALQPTDFVNNFSMPLAVLPHVLYITTTGSDIANGDPNYGTTQLTAFATFDAAINHAKTYVKFIGRLSTVEFRFGPGSWGVLALGSNLDQGEDEYPFAIHITSIDNSNRARFVGVSNGGWNPVYLYATKIKSGYFVVTRRNAMTVNDVDLTADGVAGYAFRAAFGAKMNVFGDVDVEVAVNYATAFIYCQDMGYISLENGDVPSIFPAFNLLNAGNITSPSKYRLVLGSGAFIPSNPYPMLTFASAYHVDASSYSTQTTGAQDLNLNTAAGGPIVAKTGTSVTGSERRADGGFRQWGILAVTGAAAGVSTPASALLTFPTAFGANPRIKFHHNLSTVIVTAPQAGTTNVQFTTNVLSGAPAAFNIYWEATGNL